MKAYSSSGVHITTYAVSTRQSYHQVCSCFLLSLCLPMQLVRRLRTDGFPALGLHGDKSQQERDWVLAEFRSGKHAIMIATDVAARGLGKALPALSAADSKQVLDS